MSSKKLSSVSIGTFIGMTIALAASIRNVPDVAAAGWPMFLYMAIATFMFALPICLIAGEFGSTFPEKGGPELWVRNTLGDDFGFATSWLLWTILFPGMVVVASALPPLIAVAVNKSSLGTDNMFTLIVILVSFWGMTFLNRCLDMAKITGKWVTWIGIYIPFIIMTLLGIAALIKTGIHPNSILQGMHPEKIIPLGSSGAKSLNYFSPIALIFVGIELSSVYITRLHKASDYPIGVLATLLFMLVLNLINGFMESAIISPSKINLNNIVQPIIVYNQILGLPAWINNIFSILVAIGVCVQLSAWVSGPGKTMLASARDGYISPKLKFWKKDKFGDSPAIMYVQAIVVSIFSCAYLLIPDINRAFLDLVNATNVIYCMVYIFMAIGFIKMRVKEPNLKSDFKVGNSTVAWIIGIVLIVTIIVIMVATFIVGTLFNFIIVAGISAVIIILPFIFYHFKKDSWATEVKALIKEKKN
ncbi:amino acid permease [Limosilactobacillus reuteri]|uniref:amino acid permease n=1 Tax=Limosilactobacillus reuteri TaxID=1598 RepID=UPI001E4BE7C9|nr:amino acid permease [Limosilactobacillus reuteri]MCC4382636.1 APC family permease [Limosilactobacillus reuteri]MCC4419443.1 APC family permease [Limosilactobacillus reuteri]MCI7719923.1 APC family permease [Limosilactobacillus reuteri]